MQNQFRIIGGAWRSRRFTFPDVPGLRPSPDRVRETLFNWLAPTLHGAHCIDLFAGSGALGLEALSRGAAACVFVDRERAALDAIAAHLTRVGSATGTVVNSTVAAFLLRAPARPADVVFLDPPFDAGLVEPTLAALATGAWLAPGAHVYVEMEAGTEPVWPAGWQPHRSGRAGRVGYHLAIGSR